MALEHPRHHAIQHARAGSLRALSTAAARPHRRSPAAQADRVAVRVGEHADPGLGCDFARGAPLRCAGREQGCAGCVEILDVGVGHWTAGRLAWSQADLEAVDVVPDVVGLIQCAACRAARCRAPAASRSDTGITRLRIVGLMFVSSGLQAVTAATAAFVDGMTDQGSRI